MQPVRSRWWWLPCIAAGLTVIGARLWLISRYGTSLPINDQWGAEGFYLLKPWYEGRLNFSDLFAPHNEHRIFFSRLLALALTWFNGQWDSLPEMVFDAIFAGAIAAVIVGVLFSLLNHRFHIAMGTTVTLWLALPYAHENTLWGFQSSFYFLLFFSLLGIWGLTLYQPWTPRWFAGALGAICACLSMGSGLLASFAVALIVVIQVILKGRTLRGIVPTVVLASLILLISFHFRVTVPQHAIYKAHSLSAGATFFGRCLAWPWSDYPFVALVAYAPLALLVIHELVATRARQSPPDKSIQLTFAVGIWVILQAAALAYSRGGSGEPPISSRYLDILGLGVVVNVISVCLLLKLHRKGRSPWLPRLAGAGWLAATLTLSVTASYREVQGQYKRQDYLHDAETAVRGYLATKSHSYLEGEPHPVPYPDVEAIAMFLNDNTIQTLLPASARLPLRLEQSLASDRSFTQPGCPPTIATPLFDTSWGSYSTQGAAERGSMRSKVIRSRLPYLEFEIAGGLGPEMSLSVESGARTRKVHWLQYYPAHELRPQWRLAYAALPQSEVEIAARDNSAEEWFAFRGPREMGRLSYYSYRIVQSGKDVCFWGMALGILCILTSISPLAIAFKKLLPDNRAA